MLLASEVLREDADAYVLTEPLTDVAVPETLQDSLMARLDQLGAAKSWRNGGPCWAGSFRMPCCKRWRPRTRSVCRRGSPGWCKRSCCMYQRGRPPRASYLFKHALIQDAAYASLLRSTRQQIHQQVVQLLETQFPEMAETQPELVAHHYTAANQPQAAIAYWQWAGQQRSSVRPTWKPLVTSHRGSHSWRRCRTSPSAQNMNSTCS
jgi:hypothetical protein